MNGHQARPSRAVAWWVIAGCLIVGCTGAPASGGPASTSGASGVPATVRTLTTGTVRRDVVTLPSGERMQRMSSPTAFSHVVIARVNPDGSASLACVHDASEAEAFLASDHGAGQ